MNLYFTLATYAIAASMGFGAAWRWQSANITALHLEHAEQTLSLELEARDETERHLAQIAAAQAKAQIYVRRTVAERTAADVAGAGLRITTAATVQAASQDTATCPERARTLGVVFDQCAEALVEVAESADNWHREAITQHEAAQ